MKENLLNVQYFWMKEDDAFLRIRKVRRETKHIMIICSSNWIKESFHRHCDTGLMFLHMHGFLQCIGAAHNSRELSHIPALHKRLFNTWFSALYQAHGTEYQPVLHGIWILSRGIQVMPLNWDIKIERNNTVDIVTRLVTGRSVVLFSAGDRTIYLLTTGSGTHLALYLVCIGGEGCFQWLTVPLAFS